MLENGKIVSFHGIKGGHVLAGCHARGIGAEEFSSASPKLFLPVPPKQTRKVTSLGPLAIFSYFFRGTEGYRS